MNAYQYYVFLFPFFFDDCCPNRTIQIISFFKSLQINIDQRLGQKSDIEGNEMADELAKIGPSSRFCEPDPCMPLADTIMRHRTKKWAMQQTLISENANVQILFGFRRIYIAYQKMFNVACA
jgi:hypothetical protein